MATIVNNPAPAPESGGGMGMIIGLIIFAAVLFIFFVYGLPAINQTSSPQINIPEKINVDINQKN